MILKRTRQIIHQHAHKRRNVDNTCQSKHFTELSSVKERTVNQDGFVDTPSRHRLDISQNAYINTLRDLANVFLPFDRFSTSIYSTPALLLLRLFYQASPLQLDHIREPLRDFYLRRDQRYRGDSSGCHQNSLSSSTNMFPKFDRLPTHEFLQEVLDDPQNIGDLRIKSITWVKALASPLSHEYLQVIAHDTITQGVYRLILDRSDQGDLFTVGWDWTSPTYPSHHFILPLPLLTVHFDYQSGSNRVLMLGELAKIASATSSFKPYSLAKEQCWWYAESVLLSCISGRRSVQVEEWPHARLRYSFVVKTDWLQRPAMVKAAEAFRDRCRTGLDI